MTIADFGKNADDWAVLLHGLADEFIYGGTAQEDAIRFELPDAEPPVQVAELPLDAYAKPRLGWSDTAHLALGAEEGWLHHALPYQDSYL